MTDQIIQLIEKYWHCLTTKQLPFHKEWVLVTKFSQESITNQRKVLFLISYESRLICVLKMMRSLSFNQGLRNELKAQKSIVASGIVSVPKIYFEDVINEYYMYAEEVLTGESLTNKSAKRYEPDIVNFVQSLPRFDGKIKTRHIFDIFSKHILPKENDEHIIVAIELLGRIDMDLQRGFTHGDLGRSNIIHDGKRLNIIDWGQAGKYPFYLIDIVNFMITASGNIKNIEDWRKNALPSFIKYTKVDTVTAEALYCIMITLRRCRRRYPELYDGVVKDILLE